MYMVFSLIMEAAVFAAGVVIGVLMGLLGGGGSILAVPVFVYTCGMPPKIAIVLALVVVGCTSAVGALSHFRRGNVDVPKALIFSGFSAVGSFAGARAAVFLTGEIQLLIFALIMLLAAFFMLRPRRTQSTTRPEPRANSSMFMRVALPSLGVGLLTGLVGVGGGFMIVPVLSLILGMDMAKSVGTSLFVIAVNSLFGSFGYFSQPDLAAAMNTINVGSLSITSFVLMFLGCMFLGVWTGSALSSRVRAATLKRMFGVLLLVVATMMIAQRLGMW